MASLGEAVGGILGSAGGVAKASGHIGKALMNSKSFGTASKYLGNPTIANRLGAGAKGLLNNKNSFIRTGWSVHGTDKYTSPVLRTSIGFGKRVVHINWSYGRFYR